MAGTKTRISTTSKSDCPACRSKYCHRSQFKFTDLPYLLIGFHAMRCDECEARFFRHRLATFRRSPQGAPRKSR